MSPRDSNKSHRCYPLGHAGLWCPYVNWNSPESLQGTYSRSKFPHSGYVRQAFTWWEPEDPPRRNGGIRPLPHSLLTQNKHGGRPCVQGVTWSHPFIDHEAVKDMHPVTCIYVYVWYLSFPASKGGGSAVLCGIWPCSLFIMYTKVNISPLYDAFVFFQRTITSCLFLEMTKKKWQTNEHVGWKWVLPRSRKGYIKTVSSAPPSQSFIFEIYVFHRWRGRYMHERKVNPKYLVNQHETGKEKLQVKALSEHNWILVFPNLCRMWPN